MLHMNMAELKRNLAAKVNQLLVFFPVVVILGTRQCGKTTLAKRLRPKWRYFDLERLKDFELVTNDFEFFIKEYPHSIIFDEAQTFPTLFQELRGVIDRDRQRKNRFLITGSSSLELIKNVSESLAGRVALVELGTFKANEKYELDLPDFYKIFDKDLSETTINFIKGLKLNVTHNQLMEIFLQGGYPEPVLENNAYFFTSWMENYFQTYIQRDIRTLFPRLNITKYQRFIAMLSALSGTIINRSQLGRSLDITEKSIRDYLEIAGGSYIWRNIPSYEKSKSKSIVKMPKGNFRDCGLAHFIQGITNREQLINYPNVGISFLAFIIEEIIKGIQATNTVNWDYHYFRTRNGAEIDLILEGPFGVLPIEIKFGKSIKPRHIRSIKDFVFKNKLPLGIVINNSDRVELIAERIIQLPAGCI